MNILFITSNRLGDGVLSSGLVDYLIRTYPDAQVTIACGPLPAPLFEGVPNLRELIAFKKEKHNKHWLKLWMKLVGTRWDIVVDLRDSIVSRALFAKKRYIHTKRIDKKIHKVAQNAQVMHLENVPDTRLWVTGEQAKNADELMQVSDDELVLGIGPTSNWIGKTWPGDRFIKLVKILTGPQGIMPNAKVAIFAAPGEEADAIPVLESIPKERQIDLIAKADPGTVAACLQRCDLYIGHDSGLMHCAAAAGTPTVGLFGPGWPEIYGPWGKRTTWVQTPEKAEELIGYPGYDSKKVGSLMLTLTIEAVAEKIEAFWADEKNRKPDHKKEARQKKAAV